MTISDDEYIKKIGANIRRIRLEKKIKQVDLAYACGFEKSNMRRIEAGNTNPNIKTLLIVARNLEVNVIDLLSL